MSKKTSPNKTTPKHTKKNKTIKNINNITLPPKINKKKTIEGAPDKYKPKLALSIIEQIATDSTRDIDQICVDNGIERTTLHKWKLMINDFATALDRAKESRADTEIESLTIKLRDLTQLIEDNDDMDARDKHVRIQLFHRMMQHTHWIASKHSEKYRDTPGIQINIDAGGRRAAAWDRWQEIRASKKPNI